jgi:hypothetical protein
LIISITQSAAAIAATIMPLPCGLGFDLKHVEVADEPFRGLGLPADEDLGADVDRRPPPRGRGRARILRPREKMGRSSIKCMSCAPHIQTIASIDPAPDEKRLKVLARE